MTALRVTLRAEGPSDDMLLPIIRWMLRRHLGDIPIDDYLADTARLRQTPKTLAEKIAAAEQLFPCDVLFVHLDADTDPELKRQQIQEAVEELRIDGFATPHVCVIPVRESEAWLLIDEAAVREAAGNRRGKLRLNLPSRKRIESVADPKRLLNDLIRKASELTGRGWEKFQRRFTPFLVADCITDFSPLLDLPAFRAFDADVKAFAESWATDPPGEPAE